MDEGKEEVVADVVLVRIVLECENCVVFLNGRGEEKGPAWCIVESRAEETCWFSLTNYITCNFVQQSNLVDSVLHKILNGSYGLLRK